MDHTPFIWSAYGLTAAVLAWTALAPVLRRRRALAQVRQVANATRTHAPQATRSQTTRAEAKRTPATRPQGTPEHEHDPHA